MEGIIARIKPEAYADKALFEEMVLFIATQLKHADSYTWDGAKRIDGCCDILDKMLKKGE